MAPINVVTVLESFRAAPPPGTVSEFSVPLTCADMNWIGFSPVQRLVFYEHPVSRSCFKETIIPELKNSLSLTLKHFPSLAGDLIIPSSVSSKPEIRFAEGGFLSLVFAESGFADFEYLVSDQPRDCAEFHPLVPRVPDSTESPDGSKIVPLAALQVTLFPGFGICVGIANDHVAGDGSSMYAFIRAWTAITRLGEEEAGKQSMLSPVYDREVIRHHTKDLDDVFRRDLMSIKTQQSSNEMGSAAPVHQFIPPETEKVRTTFVVGSEDVRVLKKHVIDKGSMLKHISTFTVVCGFVWACLIKSRNAVDGDGGEDESDEYFIFGADARGRTDPPIPANYFGNCLVHCKMTAKNRELAGDEGFITAAELIGDTIHKRMNYRGGILRGLETYLADISDFKGKDTSRILSVAGSPRQSYYNMDFGWGKPRKVEVTSIDSTGAISLGGCRESPGGVEIGLAMPKKKMVAFIECYREGLKALHKSEN